MALRGVAAAQDLLDFLKEQQPGHFLVPLRTGLLFTLLKKDVNCAFIFLEDTERLMFFDILTEDWRNEDNETVLMLSHQDLKNMIAEAEGYKTEMTSLLHRIQFRGFDTWQLVNKAIQNTRDVRSSLNIVKLLIDLVVSNNTMMPEMSHHCQSVCGEQQDNENTTLNCVRAALLTFRVANRIARYPVIGSGMSQLSEKQRKKLLKSAVEHDLERLVEFLNFEEGLLPTIRAAIPCGLVPLSQVLNNKQALLKMLKEHEKELLVLSTIQDEEVYDTFGGKCSYSLMLPSNNLHLNTAKI